MKTYVLVGAAGLMVAALAFFAAAQLSDSGVSPKEAASVFDAAHMKYPMPPVKAAVSAGSDLYSLDEPFLEIEPFVLGSLAPALRASEHERRHSTDSTESVFGGATMAYQAGEKGANR